MAVESDQGPCEVAALAIARAWLRRVDEPAARGAEAQRLVDEADDDGDPRPGWLALAWQAVQATRFQMPSVARGTVDEILVTLRACAWPRALRLAEAAQALVTSSDPTTIAASIGTLTAHGPADADPRPPVERLWTDATLSLLLTRVGRHDEALKAAMEAAALARRQHEPAGSFIATHALSYVFLSTGDVEGALDVLERELLLSKRTGQGRIGTRYNLMLTCLLADRPAAVLEMLRDEPWLGEPPLHVDHPSVACVLACAMARCGRADEALALLPEADRDGGFDDSPLRANRAWLAAEVLLAARRPEAARERLCSFLSAQQTARAPLSPMNATQIQRVLGEACEALHDLPAALAALRASQQHCFTWVASSVRMRLQALHLDQAHGDSDSDGDVHARRLRAVDNAASRASASSGNDAQHFVAHVAHEMRNPIAGLVGMTSLLMMSDLDQRQRKYLQLVQSSAQMLMRLCGDLLDLARLDAGQFHLHLEAVDLAELLRQAAAVFEPMAQAKGLALSVVIGEPTPRRVVSDATRLQQVIMNLLSNAIKFTQQGRVELRSLAVQATRPEAQRVRVEVRDSGPGLPAGGRERLFREFSQLESRPGGTGLGLALCRRLILRLGGDIDVDCPSTGGCIFWFELPVETASQAVPA